MSETPTLYVVTATMVDRGFTPVGGCRKHSVPRESSTRR